MHITEELRMYGILRLLLGVAIFFLSIFIIRRMDFKKKTLLTRMAFVLAIVICLVLNFVPFENAFVTFDSPEDAYRYYKGWSQEIDLFVEGRNSDFVITNKNEILIIPKMKEGWKLGIGPDIKHVIWGSSESGTISIYRYKETNDYYVQVIVADDIVQKVEDSYDSTFVTGGEERTGKVYFAALERFDKQYKIYINGEEVEITWIEE